MKTSCYFIIKAVVRCKMEKLKSHLTFGSTIQLRGIVAADGKEREMSCLPLRFLSAWLFSINPANVKDEIRENLIKYQLLCNDLLFDYFFGSYKKVNEQNKIEISLLESISELNQQQNDLKQSISEKKKQLAKIREERLNNEPTLF